MPSARAITRAQHSFSLFFFVFFFLPSDTIIYAGSAITNRAPPISPNRGSSSSPLFCHLAKSETPDSMTAEKNTWGGPAIFLSSRPRECQFPSCEFPPVHIYSGQTAGEPALRTSTGPSDMKSLVRFHIRNVCAGWQKCTSHTAHVNFREVGSGGACAESVWPVSVVVVAEAQTSWELVFISYFQGTVPTSHRSSLPAPEGYNACLCVARWRVCTQ